MPPVISSLFHLELKDAGRSYTSPKLIVYLLSRPTTSQLAGSAGCDPALQGLEHLADLLEQYYHPSNTGSCAPNYLLTRDGHTCSGCTVVHQLQCALTVIAEPWLLLYPIVLFVLLVAGGQNL